MTDATAAAVAVLDPVLAVVTVDETQVVRIDVPERQVVAVGEQGPPGAQGIQGVPGPQGVQGVAGPAGPAGEGSGTLGGLPVVITNPSNGDLLALSANQWSNTPPAPLTDGGNF